MSDVGVIILLYAAAALLLVAEAFIPSHGMLTLAAVAVLLVAIVKTFAFGTAPGFASTLICVVLLPTGGYLLIKNWHRTPVGRRISPPNPVLTAEDTGVPVTALEPLIGCAGKSISPLRPVGMCEFNGQRVACVAEMGMIDAGVSVKAVRIVGGQLGVVEHVA